MAASMVRQPSGHRFRSGRFRGRQGSGEESVHLDFSKDNAENIKEVLSYIIKQHAFSKAKKLGYLNAFVKLIQRCPADAPLGYSMHEIMCCLRVNMLHGAKEIRAATLRVLKHLICHEDSLNALLDLQIHYLVVRSLDLCLDNEIERVHAQKLVRRIVQVVPDKVPAALIYPLVAIGNDGATERDRMVRISLATICELAYFNPHLVAVCGGISMLLRKILDCYQYPRINESLVCTILHLLNHPRTRHFVHFNTDLEQLLAPFTDCHFSYNADSDQTNEDRESRFAASKMAVITVMRSWPGIVRFCRPDGTGLQSMIGILYLPFHDVRQAILEVLFELFHLKIPETTADFTQALLSTDPYLMQDNWRLTDGFVAEEGKDILPHLAKVRPNLVDNHIALLLAAWIGAGLLDALVEVIFTTEDEVFIRSVILLGELLHMGNQLMPPECGHHSHYLPSLMALASSFNIPERERHQASLAVSYLNHIHSLKKRGPIPCSLYLDQVVRQSASYKERPVALNQQKDKLLDVRKQRSYSNEEIVSQTMRDTQVLNTKDNQTWDWDLISYVLKLPDDKMRKFEDQSHVRFIRRLVFFYKPTNHLFSRLESSHKLEQKLAVAGCLLIDFLIRSDQEEAMKQLNDLLGDIGLCLSEVSMQRLAPESVLSPVNVYNTLSHYYFLFLGRLSLTTRGDRYLEKNAIYQFLLEIVTVVTQESYIKLTVSSLYYGHPGNARAVLTKALCSANEPGRLYATKLMRVLLRAKAYGFSHWGIEMLVGQLYDQSKAVAMSALSILDEACECQKNLQSLTEMKPSFLHLGQKGVMILCRYMSIPSGYKFLTEANYTANELKKWHMGFNTKYVNIVEELLNEALTTYEKTYEGSYTRRSSRRRQKKDVYVPIHLYGQLVQHKDGFHLLQEQDYIEEYFQCIRCQELNTDEDMQQLKTALWAVGHISTSSWGVSWLEEERIVPEIIRLAEECGVFSIRGTAFFVLGLMASTREGAQVLTQFGWESRWNTRAERWPLMEDHAMLLEDSVHELTLDQTFSSGTRFELGSPVSNLDFIAEEHFQLSSPPLRDYTGNEDFSSSHKTDNCDTESGIHIPLMKSTVRSGSPDLRRYAHSHRMKSMTLPREGQSPGLSLPAHAQTFRSISVSNIPKQRAVSDENLSNDAPVIKVRSQSLRLQVVTDAEDNLHVKDESVLVPDKNANVTVNPSSISVETAVNERKTEDNSPNTELSTTKESVPPATVQIGQKIQLPQNTNSTVDSNQPGSSSVNSGRTRGDSLDIVLGKDPLVINIPDSVIDFEEEGQNQQISISVTDTQSGPSDTSAVLEKVEEHVSTDNCDTGAPFTHSSPHVEAADERKSRVYDNVRSVNARRPMSLKDERNSSSESSSRTSKSRTDSFNTDITTSGIGSYDSGHHGVAELPSLSPIPSSNSLDQIEVTIRNKETKEHVHPSNNFRRLSNLSRVPSLRRQSSPGIGLLSSSKYFDFSEHAISYTTARDAMGYATLRSLMKYRTISSDLESDYGLNRLYDTDSVGGMSRRPSMDSTTTEGMRSSASLPRQMSGVSLSDFDSPGPIMSAPKAIIYQQRPHTGEAEFVGLALPVDINMIFEVHEGEDKRTCLGDLISRQNSCVDTADSQQRQERTGSFQDEIKDPQVHPGKIISGPLPGAMSSAIPSEHNKDICLRCHKWETSNVKGQTGPVDDDVKLEPQSSNLLTVKEPVRSRSSSLNDQTGGEMSGGSLTSTGASSDPISARNRKLSVDTGVGRSLLRKEVIRFVINLSSSVGVKGAEQGLLSLKQKFPKAFQDLCFYSEVSYLLGTCSFRMTARRFIQELFEDIDISQMLEEPYKLLEIEDVATDRTKVDRSLPEGLEGFSDFS